MKMVVIPDTGFIISFVNSEIPRNFRQLVIIAVSFREFDYFLECFQFRETEHCFNCFTSVSWKDSMHLIYFREAFRTSQDLKWTNFALIQWRETLNDRNKCYLIRVLFWSRDVSWTCWGTDRLRRFLTNQLFWTQLSMKENIITWR